MKLMRQMALPRWVMLLGCISFAISYRLGLRGAIIGEIQNHLSVPGSTLHYHIAKLVKVGLVEQQKKGREIICRANYDQTDSLLAFVTNNCCVGHASKNNLKSA